MPSRNMPFAELKYPLQIPVSFWDCALIERNKRMIRVNFNLIVQIYTVSICYLTKEPLKVLFLLMGQQLKSDCNFVLLHLFLN